MPRTYVTHDRWFVVSVHRAALFDDRSFASPSVDCVTALLRCSRVEQIRPRVAIAYRQRIAGNRQCSANYRTSDPLIAQIRRSRSTYIKPVKKHCVCMCVCDTKYQNFLNTWKVIKQQIVQNLFPFTYKHVIQFEIIRHLPALRPRAFWFSIHVTNRFEPILFVKSAYQYSIIVLQSDQVNAKHKIKH